MHLAPRRSLAMALALMMGLAVMVGTPAAAKKQPSKMSVSFGDRSFVTGQRYAVRGKVSGPVKRVVKLQYQTKSGWRNLDSTRTKRKGKYKLKGRWDWIGTHRVRVYAPPTKSHRARTSKVSKFKVKAGYAPRGSRKNFDLFKQRGMNFRFNPCKTVRVRVNTEGVGDTFLPIIQESIKRVSAASGLNLRYVGTTNIQPFQQGRFKNKANLIIDFGTAAEYPRFNEGVAGIGGPTFALAARQQRGGKVWDIKYAGVLINTGAIGFFAPGFSSTQAAPLGALFMHEIGHTLGLDHAAAGSTGVGDQLMSPSGPNADGQGVFEAEFARGDLAGAATRGLQQGCIKPPRKFNAARTAAGDVPRETSNGYIAE